MPSGLMLTVVVPARNEVAHIEACVESIFSGAREAALHVEVIVVDDNSSDATAARAEGAGARVVRHSRQLGPLAAWATGVAASDSAIVVFVDADCTLGTGAFLPLLDALARPTVGVAAGRAVPLPPGARDSLACQSARFSAVLLDEIKGQLHNHDFLPIGRLMALRREAWLVDVVDHPHCDRVVAAAARAAGWTVAWVPQAIVYYQLPATYAALRDDWQRTRRGLRTSSVAFDPVPRTVLLRALWASARHCPMGVVSWVVCRSALVAETIVRRSTPVGRPTSWC